MNTFLKAQILGFYLKTSENSLLIRVRHKNATVRINHLEHALRARRTEALKIFFGFSIIFRPGNPAGAECGDREILA